MQLAVFGPKVFSVSQNKIYSFNEFSISGSINKESQERDGKKPATYIKGLGLESFSLSIPLTRQKNIDVRAEFNSWRSIRDTKIPYYFLLGGKPLIPNKFILESVELSDVTISPSGIILKATIQLKFEEFAASGVKENSKSAKQAKKSNNPNYLESLLTGVNYDDTTDYSNSMNGSN